MNADEVLTTLKPLGKPQTAAIYQRHGAGDNVFGVLTSELQKLKKRSESITRWRWNFGAQEMPKLVSWRY